MKIRTDFVSNSSSCSFTVEDVSKVVALTRPLGLLGYDFDLSISIKCRYKDYDTIFEVINGEPPEKRIRGYYPSSYNIEHDPDEETEFYVNDFNTFVERYQDLSEDIKSNIKHFCISCNDYDNSSRFAMILMYHYFELSGLNPDSSNSEHELIDDQSSDLLINLVKKIGELRNAANGGNS